ncbi:MAG: type III pantothenate kinase [Brockia lithotrophica]|nr:type III pantothenate kinase [Brockia lithotrophica]
MSIFALDVGNTNVTAGIFVRGELVHVFRFASDARRTADEWVVLFTHALARAGRLSGEVEGVVLGSVVPPLTSSLREAARALFGVDPLILGPGVRRTERAMVSAIFSSKRACVRSTTSAITAYTSL